LLLRNLLRLPLWLVVLLVLGFVIWRVRRVRHIWWYPVVLGALLLLSRETRCLFILHIVSHLLHHSLWFWLSIQLVLMRIVLLLVLWLILHHEHLFLLDIHHLLHLTYFFVIYFIAFVLCLPDKLLVHIWLFLG